MATKKQRVIALSVAIFFVITSAATTVAVVYTMITSNDKPSTQTADTTAQPKANPLVGTKLSEFTPVDGVKDLQKIDTKVGTGAEVKPGATVEVLYQGALAKTGVIFDASDGQTPVSIDLNQVIDGWKEGIPGMKIGGTRRLLIPSAKAYGAQSPSASIPANSDMVFDVTLVAIK